MAVLVFVNGGKNYIFMSEGSSRKEFAATSRQEFERFPSASVPIRVLGAASQIQLTKIRDPWTSCASTISEQFQPSRPLAAGSTEGILLLEAWVRSQSGLRFNVMVDGVHYDAQGTGLDAC